MYEIRTDDTHAHLLATAATLDEAFDAFDALQAATHDQLARNGEGATSLWLGLAIHHHGDIVARAGLCHYAATEAHATGDAGES